MAESIKIEVNDAYVETVYTAYARLEFLLSPTWGSVRSRFTSREVIEFRGALRKIVMRL